MEKQSIWSAGIKLGNSCSFNPAIKRNSDKYRILTIMSKMTVQVKHSQRLQNKSSVSLNSNSKFKGIK